MRPLRDITVLELAFYYPGPLCGLLLSDMGATVIKIEGPDGDPMRHVGAKDLGSTGPGFELLNRGKKSVVIDLKTPGGIHDFTDLCTSADVLLQVLRPTFMKRLGLGPDRIRQIAPCIVHCMMTGYGATGPHADRAGHDLNYQAIAGLLAMNGLTDGTLALPGVPVADLMGALMATISILGALRERDRTNQGSLLDVSLTESALLANMLNLAGLWFPGDEARAGGTMLTGRIPAYNLYRSSDGRWFALGALEPKFWVGFCQAAGFGHLLGSQFDPAALPEMRRLFASRDSDHWVRISRENDVCLEPVLATREVLEHPLHTARGVALGRSVDASFAGLPGLASTAEPDRDVPSLGEHTSTVLKSGQKKQGKKESATR